MDSCARVVQIEDNDDDFDVQCLSVLSSHEQVRVHYCYNPTLI